MASRALLTDRERDIISGEADVSRDRRYQVVSRCRRRLWDSLTADVELLEEGHEELSAELQGIVCNGYREQHKWDRDHK